MRSALLQVTRVMNMSGDLILDPIWLPVVIFCARVADVSIGTLRMICIVRDHRPLAVMLSFAEVTIWLLAVTSVLTHLDQWWNILAYACGYATGSAVGMWIERRLALGTQMVTFVSCGAAQPVADRLRVANYRVTTLAGSNDDGPVSICYTVLPRKQTEVAIQVAREVDPDVNATVEDVRTTTLDQMAGRGPGKMLLPWRGPVLRRPLGELKHRYPDQSERRCESIDGLDEGASVPDAA